MKTVLSGGVSGSGEAEPDAVLAGSTNDETHGTRDHGVVKCASSQRGDPARDFGIVVLGDGTSPGDTGHPMPIEDHFS
jgi:hypothetical protein